MYKGEQVRGDILVAFKVRKPDNEELQQLDTKTRSPPGRGEALGVGEMYFQLRIKVSPQGASEQPDDDDFELEEEEEEAWGEDGEGDDEEEIAEAVESVANAVGHILNVL